MARDGPRHYCASPAPKAPAQGAQGRPRRALLVRFRRREQPQQAQGKHVTRSAPGAILGCWAMVTGRSLGHRGLTGANLLHSGRVTGLYSSKNHLARPVFLLSFSKALGSLR